jgi:hypothetical protein
MPSIFSRALALWLPIACATSGLFLFAFWGIQQQYRITLNDPQVQLAEDGAAALANGVTPAELVGDRPQVDIKTSLAPWIAVYDPSGTPLASTGVLDSAPPEPPRGVFNMSSWRSSAEMGIPIATPICYDRVMAILIALVASLATLIGGAFALKFRDHLHLILGFSAGAVAGVALFDLLPEAIDLGIQYHIRLDHRAYDCGRALWLSHSRSAHPAPYA